MLTKGSCITIAHTMPRRSKRRQRHAHSSAVSKSNESDQLKGSDGAVKPSSAGASRSSSDENTLEVTCRPEQSAHCSQYTLPIPIRPDAVYTFRSSKLGYGMYATIDLSYGARILKEMPAVLQDESPCAAIVASFEIIQTLLHIFQDDRRFDALAYDPCIHSMWHEIWQEYKDAGEPMQPRKLPRSSRRARAECLYQSTMHLKCPHHVPPSELLYGQAQCDCMAWMIHVLSIYETNRIVLRFRHSGKARYRAGLYRDASFINHSCIPNAIAQLHSDDGIVVHAIKQIPAGEEICISYCPVYFRLESTSGSTHPADQSWLLTHYGFRCLNSCCSGSGTTFLRERLSALISMYEEYDLALVQFTKSISGSENPRKLSAPIRRLGRDIIKGHVQTGVVDRNTIFLYASSMLCVAESITNNISGWRCWH